MGIPGDDGEKPLPFGLDVSPKGLQPKVVFTLLLIGAAGGIWLSRWGDSLLARGFWWLLVVALPIIGNSFDCEDDSFGEAEDLRGHTSQSSASTPVLWRHDPALSSD